MTYNNGWPQRKLLWMLYLQGQIDEVNHEGTMQITIPDELTEQLQQLAGVQRQPVEQLVLERLRQLLDEQLTQLPAAEQAELAALQYLSDDALRAIAAEQMAQSIQRRMAVLMKDNSQGTITPEERQELTMFVERGDQLMLRKAEAARLLQQRGYAITTDDLALTDD